LIRKSDLIWGQFKKQFNDVIEKQLTKPLKLKPENPAIEASKKPLTLIMNLDGTLLKTSVFESDLPSKADSSFIFNSLTIYVSLRPHFDAFLTAMSEFCDLVVWSASPPDYTSLVVQSLPEHIRSMITHVFNQSHC
jgi:TFIIF-interacting CTD phosphatase-like protein